MGSTPTFGTSLGSQTPIFNDEDRRFSLSAVCKCGCNYVKNGAFWLKLPLVIAHMLAATFSMILVAVQRPRVGSVVASRGVSR